jgi:hypothetical protein
MKVFEDPPAAPDPKKWRCRTATRIRTRTSFSRAGQAETPAGDSLPERGAFRQHAAQVQQASLQSPRQHQTLFRIRDVDKAKLIRDYIGVVAQLKDSVAGLSDAQRRSHPVPGKWSIHEVVCHIADFEPISTDRICRVIALDRPALIGADESEFAKTLAYEDRDFDEQIHLIEVLRSHTARILKTLPDAAFERVGVHNEAGPMTLEQLLVRVTSHLPHHIAFINEKRRALGV